MTKIVWIEDIEALLRKNGIAVKGFWFHAGVDPQPLPRQDVESMVMDMVVAEQEGEAGRCSKCRDRQATLGMDTCLPCRSHGRQ